MDGKRILLIVGGGIAAYKALDLIRRLRERGASVRVVITRAGTEFITPLSATVLSSEAAFTELFDPKDEAAIGHIELSREADLLVVAPATADLIAKLAHGQADDLATAVLLATDKSVLLAPAMNVRMWTHPATQRNVAQVGRDGALMVGPNEGDMACGEWGPGRMAEVDEIVSAIASALEAPPHSPSLVNRHVLVTSGPTHEPIDPVRYIANRSSGRQGHAIAAAAAREGARVTLVTGPTELADPPGVAAVCVETAEQMLQAALGALPADIAICAAAVADWRIANATRAKIKKQSGEPTRTLELAENPDILRTIANHDTLRPELVIGFAAETHDVLEHARQKRRNKGADWIVANDVSDGTGIMGGSHNAVHLVTADGIDTWPHMAKEDVARKLISEVGKALAERKAAAE